MSHSSRSHAPSRRSRAATRRPTIARDRRPARSRRRGRRCRAIARRSGWLSGCAPAPSDHLDRPGLPQPSDVIARRVEPALARRLADVLTRAPGIAGGGEPERGEQRADPGVLPFRARRHERRHARHRQGRCESTSAGAPQRPAPIRAVSRACSAASWSSDGSALRSSENWTMRPGTGSTVTVSRSIAACGGCASRSSSRSVRSTRASRTGTGNSISRTWTWRSVRCSDSRTTAAARSRASRCAHNGSSTRPSTNDSGSSPSIGHSSASDCREVLVWRLHTQRPGIEAHRQPLQPEATVAEPGLQVGGRQAGQRPARGDPPALQRGEHVGPRPPRRHADRRVVHERLASGSAAAAPAPGASPTHEPEPRRQPVVAGAPEPAHAHGPDEHEIDTRHRTERLDRQGRERHAARRHGRDDGLHAGRGQHERRHPGRSEGDVHLEIPIPRERPGRGGDVLGPAQDALQPRHVEHEAARREALPARRHVGRHGRQTRQDVLTRQIGAGTSGDGGRRTWQRTSNAERRTTGSRSRCRRVREFGIRLD